MKKTGIKVRFLGDICDIVIEEYRNGRKAISLYSADGEPYCVATVNLPDETLSEKEIFIKDYSENAGILDILIDAGVISEPIDTVKTGWVTVPKCKLLVG